MINKNDIIYTGQKSRSGVLTAPRFDLTQIGKRDAVDQEGPGFYFTTNKDEALGYAYPNGILVTANFVGDKLITTKSKINRKHVEQMIKLAPNLDNILSNWGYDPGYVSKQQAINELKDSIYSEDNAKNIWLSVWYELYHEYPKEYVENMVKLGYDGVFVEKNDNVNHIIIYNIKSINIVNFESYKKYNTENRNYNILAEQANRFLFEDDDDFSQQMDHINYGYINNNNKPISFQSNRINGGYIKRIYTEIFNIVGEINNKLDNIKNKIQDVSDDELQPLENITNTLYDNIEQFNSVVNTVNRMINLELNQEDQEEYE